MMVMLRSIIFAPYYLLQIRWFHLGLLALSSHQKFFHFEKSHIFTAYVMTCPPKYSTQKFGKLGDRISPHKNAQES